MIFHSQQIKAQQPSTHKMAASTAALSKTQSFRNTQENPKNAKKISSLRILLKNANISRPKDKWQAFPGSLAKVPLYMRSGVQSKLKKRPAKRELVQSLDLSASIWCLYDSESKKHIGFRQDCKREIASLTKIMTTIVSIEAIQRLAIPLDLRIRVTATARSMVGTSAGLKANYWITLQDLLYGVMLPSGNDAAYAVAEYLGFVMYRSSLKKAWLGFGEGLDLTREQTVFYVQEFIRAMNAKAKVLKLKSTCFSNPHGLANAMNTSSAIDLIKISRHSVTNGRFKQIMNAKVHQYALHELQKPGKTIVSCWRNTNILLEKGWQGVKTGHTPSAGGCLSSLKDGIYIVILNSANDETRFSDTQKIYEWYRRRREAGKTVKRAVSEAAESRQDNDFAMRYKPVTELSDYA